MKRLPEIWKYEKKMSLFSFEDYKNSIAIPFQIVTEHFR